MSDRAHYLARTLMARLARLHASCAEDGRGEPDRRERIDAIGKVLAIELGVTDGTTLALIDAAAPHVGTTKFSERDVAGFAAFLRTRLGSLLTER